MVKMIYVDRNIFHTVFFKQWQYGFVTTLIIHNFTIGPGFYPFNGVRPCEEKLPFVCMNTGNDYTDIKASTYHDDIYLLLYVTDTHLILKVIS